MSLNLDRDIVRYVSLREKRFVATEQFFLEAVSDGAAPTVTCSGAQTPAAPTNGTAGAAGETSHPLQMGSDL